MTSQWELTLRLGSGTNELERLQSLETKTGFLFPQGVRMTDASLTVNGTGQWARVDFSFYGRKPDGTEHKRRTNDCLYLSKGSAGYGWLRTLAPHLSVQERLAFQSLWPKDAEEVKAEQARREKILRQVEESEKQ